MSIARYGEGSAKRDIDGRLTLRFSLFSQLSFKFGNQSFGLLAEGDSALQHTTLAAHDAARFQFSTDIGVKIVVLA